MTEKPERLTSVDVLRGLIIVLMALDHSRDYIFSPSIDPTDLAHTSVVLFFTRWVTHYCAPLFMFLAGVGASLSLGRGRTQKDLSHFLLTRGLWLALLELTWVRSIGWVFNFDYSLVLIGVLWALGWSMVTLSVLIRIPIRVLTAISIAGIVLHHLTDGWKPEMFGPFAVLWRLLHVPGLFYQSPSVMVTGGYVVIPWAFVMALGYCFGPIFKWDAERRRRALLQYGAALTAAFVVIRGINIYGDPAPWQSQPDAVFTFLSFLNTSKYPPSLCYVLMTLGPGMLLLGLFEHWRNAASRFFLVFGQVPLFFYLLHIPVIHAVAVAAAYLKYGTAHWLFENPKEGFPFDPPPGYGNPLWAAYLVWIAVVFALYPLCRWFAEYKRINKSAWLSYL